MWAGISTESKGERGKPSTNTWSDQPPRTWSKRLVSPVNLFALLRCYSSHTAPKSILSPTHLDHPARFLLENDILSLMQNACKTSTLFHKVEFSLRHMGERGRRRFLARRGWLEEQRSRGRGTRRTKPGAEAEGAAIGVRAGGSKDLKWPPCYIGDKTQVWLSLALWQSHGVEVDRGILHPL